MNEPRGYQLRNNTKCIAMTLHVNDNQHHQCNKTVQYVPERWKMLEILILIVKFSINELSKITFRCRNNGRHGRQDRPSTSKLCDWRPFFCSETSIDVGMTAKCVFVWTANVCLRRPQQQTHNANCFEIWKNFINVLEERHWFNFKSLSQNFLLAIQTI